MAPPAVVVLSSLTPGQVDDIHTALEQTTRADGVAPLSEAARLRLRPGSTDGVHLVAAGPEDVGIAGYAQVDRVDGAADAESELFVVPAGRRQGLGRRLGQAALDVVRAVPGGRGQLAMWAHGDLPGSAELADRLGLVRTRDLWQLRRQFTDPLPEPVVPPDVTVRTFRPGADEAAWLRLNATAFAEHPEQGSWTAHDLELREQEPWFDPGGFFLAERDGRLVGFHWTKVHTDEAPALGEVYVLGVDPGEAGHGLGSLLTAVGLRHLQQHGLETVLLYVEADNAAALAVYLRAGFERYAVDVSYSSAADDSAS